MCGGLCDEGLAIPFFLHSPAARALQAQASQSLARATRTTTRNMRPKASRHTAAFIKHTKTGNAACTTNHCALCHLLESRQKPHPRSAAGSSPLYRRFSFSWKPRIARRRRVTPKKMLFVSVLNLRCSIMKKKGAEGGATKVLCGSPAPGRTVFPLTCH